ncbi:MAG TPA: hypothetical protein VG965_06985 [Patescibacteria group bacterium]|nr:hypothetical protein [Patescibacteria group bacterium]
MPLLTKEEILARYHPMVETQTIVREEDGARTVTQSENRRHPDGDPNGIIIYTTPGSIQYLEKAPPPKRPPRQSSEE